MTPLIFLSLPLIVIDPYFSLLSLFLVVINHYITRGTRQPTNRDSNLFLFMYSKRMYLHSPDWALKRSKVLDRDFHTCQSCGATTSLEVHHMRGYDLIPNEPISCLVTVCRECHQYQHDSYGYPKFIVDYMLWDAPLIIRKK